MIFNLGNGKKTESEALHSKFLKNSTAPDNTLDFLIPKPKLCTCQVVDVRYNYKDDSPLDLKSSFVVFVHSEQD